MEPTGDRASIPGSRRAWTSFFLSVLGLFAMAASAATGFLAGRERT